MCISGEYKWEKLDPHMFIKRLKKRREIDPITDTQIPLLNYQTSFTFLCQMIMDFLNNLMFLYYEEKNPKKKPK